MLCQKLVRKRKKQDGKQNKRYDINSYFVNYARTLWFNETYNKEKKEKGWEEVMAKSLAERLSEAKKAKQTPKTKKDAKAKKGS